MADLISRKALVTKLSQGYWDWELQKAKNDPCVIDAMIDWAIRIVKEMPLESPWHTGTPTEDGWYLIAIRFGNRIEYESRKCRRTIDNNGNECMRFDGCNPVLAWQKITPYQGEKNN